MRSPSCPAALLNPSQPFPGEGGWLHPTSILPSSTCGLLFSGGLGPTVRTTPHGPRDSEGVTEVCSPAPPWPSWGDPGAARASRGALCVPPACAVAHALGCPSPACWGLIQLSMAWSRALPLGGPQLAASVPELEYTAKAGCGLLPAGRPASLCLSHTIPATRRELRNSTGGTERDQSGKLRLLLSLLREKPEVSRMLVLERTFTHWLRGRLRTGSWLLCFS